MNTPFRDLIRNQKLKAPTDRGFELKAWENAWKKTENDDEKHIYEAGITFSKLLGDIRTATTEHYEQKFPGISLSRMLELYCCISNRDIAVASRTMMESLSKGASIHSVLMDNNPAGNPLSSEEISVGAVDGIQPAIRNCLYNIKKETNFPTGNNKTNPIDFIRYESLLSNLYSSYEQYFQALIWGDYTYKKTGTKISIQQVASENELALEVSSLRKSRSHMRNALFSAHPDATKLLHGRYNYIKIEFKKSEPGKLSVTPIEKASARLQAEHAGLVLGAGDAASEFPAELLERTVANNAFCLKEALEVFRHLSMIAKQLASRTMQFDGDIFTTNLMLNYIAQIGRQDLIQAISRATKFSSSKTREIIDFVCFSGAPKQDLWSHPIIETRKGKLSFILAAASSPIMLRVLENWLSECFSNDDIKDKGKVYESTVCAELNTMVSKNNLITDSSPATSITISINGNKEEIDLLARIGSVILVGELKSIITSDNPRSHFRAKEKLELGAAQAKRKAEFITGNLEESFNQLKWRFESGKHYTILPVVISNNKIFSGFPIQEIPVVDLAILRSYIGQTTFPLISYYDTEAQKTITTAMYRLYDNFEQLQENLSKFLLLPPAIEGESEGFVSKPTEIPGTSFEIDAIEYSRLVYSELSDAKSKLERSKNFPIEKTDHHEKLINTLHTLC